MSWIKIDDGFYRNEKRWELELEGIGLWLVCLCYAGDQLTDGFVPEKFVLSNVPKNDRRGIVKTLLQAGLLEQVDKGYQIPKFLDYNPSRVEVEERRSEVSKKRSSAGKRGAESRWGDGKPDGKAMANASQQPWQPDGPVPGPVLLAKSESTLRVVEGDASAWVDELVPDPRLDEDGSSSEMTA